MAKRKPHESESEPLRDTIPEHVSEWAGLFCKHFEINLLDRCASMPANASDGDYRLAAVQAMIETLRDSGMDAESAPEILGLALLKDRSAPHPWKPEMDRRRFELIDREIQGVLTASETIELATLTAALREQVETEANFPIDGAKKLHRKLLEMSEGDTES